VLELCSEVAVQRPLHAALEKSGEEAELALESSSGRRRPSDGSTAAAVQPGAGSGVSGCASFEVLMRAVELHCSDAADAEEETLAAFVSCGGKPDGSGQLCTKRLKAVCKDFGLLGIKSELEETMSFEAFKSLLNA
jgi:hypothetical protein